MIKNDRISILMGVCNAENTMRRAIDSIIEQSYKNWELIVCDDGSIDSSFRIAKEYAAADSRIIAFRNKRNHGLGYALNRCFDRSSGSLIARMDADDISLPHRLEKERDFLMANPDFAAVSSALVFFNKEYGDMRTTHVKEVPKSADFVLGSPFAHAPCMMRRECFQAVNGYNEGRETLRVEDTDLWFRFMKAGFRFYNLQEPLYKVYFDEAAVQRQTFQSRWNGAMVRLKGSMALHLPFWYYILAFKTVAVGLVPARVRYRIHGGQTPLQKC